MMICPWDDNIPPDFVNASGVKWWADKYETAYARSKLGFDAAVWYVEDTDGRHTRLLTELGKILHEDTTLEGMACHIDVLWMARKED